VEKDVLHVGKVVDWDKKKSTVLSAFTARQDCTYIKECITRIYCRAAWPTLPWPAVNYCPIGFKDYKWAQ
jgi:hypothetical protein